jgi:eukaryotic-like serine/threonine-protein kinase
MFLSDASVERLRMAAFLSDPNAERLPDIRSGLPHIESNRYVIKEEIGRGGMGAVYLAIDTVLDREVAIKVPNDVANAGLERRLQAEERVLASLEHPGIVPIHDAGRLADGRLFYVMKRVRGRTLREHLGELPDTIERLCVFERICEPVAFAHAHGVIHRDLKPENVMIGEFGEVMVMDWGVAKRLGSDAEPLIDGPGPADGHATDPGTIVGTRGFMPPEQARGGLDPVDRRADVFGLGAVLFLLLTGESPPAAADAAAAIAARRDIPRPLRAICARALVAEPAGRYPSVAALAADVARYRADRAVEAHRENLLERARRLGRTHRTAIVLVLAYLFMRAFVAFSTGR